MNWLALYSPWYSQWMNGKKCFHLPFRLSSSFMWFGLTQLTTTAKKSYLHSRIDFCTEKMFVWKETFYMFFLIWLSFEYFLVDVFCNFFFIQSVFCIEKFWIKFHHRHRQVRNIWMKKKTKFPFLLWLIYHILNTLRWKWQCFENKTKRKQKNSLSFWFDLIFRFSLHYKTSFVIVHHHHNWSVQVQLFWSNHKTK